MSEDNSKSASIDSSLELQKFFDLSLDMLCIAGTDATFKRVNPQFTKVLGFSSEELVARPFLDFIHPDDISKTLKEVEKLSKGYNTINFENRYRCKDGSYRILSWKSSSDPKTGYIYAVARDVTSERDAEVELKQTISNLADTKVLLEDTARMARIGGWELDLQSGRVIMSKETLQLHELDETDPAPVLGDGSQWYPPEVWPTVRAAVDNAISKGTPYDLEAPFISAKGKKLWVRILGNPIIVDDKVIKLRGTFQDLTAKKKQELELKEANLRLIQSSKLASLGEMSAGVAHEINNPLAIISGTLDLLPRFVSNPEKFSEKIITIQKAVGRITKIVLGLKKFSRSDVKSDYKTHILKDIINESISLTTTKSKRHGAIVHADIRSKASILCDEIEIEQVLVNLIGNAVDAVKSRDEKWIKIELYDDGTSVVVRITDSGPGIPEQIRHKLFDPFFTTKAVGEGTGLGLSISKGILEEHKASIAVVTNLPNTCFEIRFKKEEVTRVAA